MKMIRDTIFVCSAIKDGKLVSKTFSSSSQEEAKNIFEVEYGINPENISGPFYHKKSNIIKKNTEMKFYPGDSKKAVYKGWFVTAMPLAIPANSAFVIFDQRVDGQRIKKPNSMIVRIEELETNEITKNISSKNAEGS